MEHNFSILEWSENPTVILVETTNYPVDRIPFPSVTICQQDTSPNPWNFMEKLLNFVEYPCYEDDRYAAVFVVLRDFLKVIAASERTFSTIYC